jgi:hypothetical protein
MKININKHRDLVLDGNKWMLSSTEVCTLVKETKDNFTLKDKNGIEGILSKNIFRANQLSWSGNKVELTPALYEEFIIKPFRTLGSIQFNTLFKDKAHLIFTHQELILEHAEYYLLKPNLLNSFDPFLGSFQVSLGALIQAWRNDPEFYFSSFSSKKELFLIAVSGSVLSNRHTATFWCRSENKVLKYNSLKNPLPSDFRFYLEKFKALNKDNLAVQIDFQYEALSQLIRDIQ